jgi:hypothetical protein
MEQDNPNTALEPTDEDAARGFRWLIIPAALFLLFGVMRIFGSAPFMMMPYFRALASDAGAINIAPGYFMHPIALLLNGLLWIAVGLVCWRGRWREAAVLLVIALAAEILRSMAFG